MTSKKRVLNSLRGNIQGLKEGEHYLSDSVGPAPQEKALFKTSDPEEKNTEKSKAELNHLALSFSTRRDMNLFYANPQEMLTTYGKYVDENPAFDKPPPSQLQPEDFVSKQQVNLVIQGRTNFAKEDQKYSQPLSETNGMAMNPGPPATEAAPGVTPAMQRELARAALMETTQPL